MFIPKTIIEYNNRIDREIDENNSVYFATMNKISFFERRRLIIINSLIQNIIRIIEMESYWEYTNEGFIYKTDFIFDIKRMDIIYKENRILKDDNGYHVKDEENLIEKEFYDKYKDLLDRLYILEMKRNEIYNKNSSDIEKTTEKKESSPYATDFTYFFAEDFFTHYSYEGINAIVNLLNNVEINDVDNAYNELMNSNMNTILKKYLLNWAATYSKKGRQILKIYFEKRDNNCTHKSISDIMDKILIKCI